jgi:hypothetical protein
MNDRMKNIFSEGDCLSEEQIKNYVQGKLKVQEMHAVEHHLTNCDLCSDAVEGLQLMNEPEKLTTIKRELHERIQILIEKPAEEQVKVLFPWRIAAAFALIFISGATLWLILPKQDNSKLFTQEYKPYPAPETQAPLLNEETSKNTVAIPEKEVVKESLLKEKIISKETLQGKVAAEENANELVQSNVQKEESRDVVSAKDADEIKTPAAGVEVSDKQLTTMEIKPGNTFTQTIGKDQQAIREVAAATTESVALTKESKKQNKSKNNEIVLQEKYKEGIDAYQKGNYFEAVKLLDEAGDYKDALFYSGVSYLSLENPHIAIERLQKFRTLGVIKLTEASYWYESLAHLKTDNKNAARICLSEVIKINGSYKERAEQLLKKL